jgi:hypothetical protein
VSRAAIALGWDDNLWSGLSSDPESYGKRWDQLSKDEKSAATVLCHCNISWPGDGATIDLLDQYNNADKRASAGMILTTIAATIVLCIPHC